MRSDKEVLREKRIEKRRESRSALIAESRACAESVAASGIMCGGCEHDKVCGIYRLMAENAHAIGHMASQPRLTLEEVSHLFENLL